jgi:protein-disulfide isomerase
VAEAAEAAAAQEAFWPMHELLIAHQSALELHDLRHYAAEVGLDVERFWDDLRARTHTHRVAEDAESADMSGVTGTPSFFVNARRHDAGYDITTLSRLVREALEAHHDRRVDR